MDEIRRELTDMQALEGRVAGGTHRQHESLRPANATIDRYCGNIRGHYSRSYFMCG